MKIINDSTPKKDGFAMPAEFAPHEGCMMIYPERSDSWQYGGYSARKAFVQVAEVIARSEEVTVCASAGQYDNARAMLPAEKQLHKASISNTFIQNFPVCFKRISPIS